MQAKRNLPKGILDVQKLFAPFDGQITAPRHPENTNVLPVPRSEIATIVQLDPIYVRAPQAVKRVLHRLLSGESNTAALSWAAVKLRLPNGQMYPYEVKTIT